MGLNLSYDYGQTPITEEEIDDLRIKTISTKADLDEFEQKNIEIAVEWTMKHTSSIDEILSIEFIKEVHRRMFNKVWNWAGKFRKTNKNIGVDKRNIYIELAKLANDVKFWIENKTFSEDEIAIRFKYRLVKIHPFPNGNGRHSRLCANILILDIFNKPEFTWGSHKHSTTVETRKRYIDAIHSADNHNIIPLLTFARS